MHMQGAHQLTVIKQFKRRPNGVNLRSNLPTREPSGAYRSGWDRNQNKPLGVHKFDDERSVIAQELAAQET